MPLGELLASADDDAPLAHVATCVAWQVRLLPPGTFIFDVAGIGADGQVYPFNWASGAQTQVTNDGMLKGGAVLSDDYVAWFAYTRLVDQELPLAHIAVLDRRTGEVHALSNHPPPGNEPRSQGVTL